MAISASLFYFAISSVVVHAWEVPVGEGASLEGRSFLDGTHALPHTLPHPKHLPENSPPVSKMYFLIREAALPDQDSHGEMQERAESVQPDQNINTAIAWIRHICMLKFLAGK